MLFRRPKVEAKTTTVTAPSTQQSTTPTTTRQLSPYEVAKRTAVRDRELVEVITTIDTSMDPATQKALMEWIREAYSQRGGGVPIGLFAKCYLGAPYIDHRLSLAADIIEHFTGDQFVPPPFGAARSLVKSDAYEFVEVYDDGAVIAVRRDGSAIT